MSATAPHDTPAAAPAAEPDRMTDLEARVTALAATLKSVLTTLMLRGLLTRAEIAPLLADAEASMKLGQGASAAKAELAAIAADLPGYLRQALGPEPDEHDHDH